MNILAWKLNLNLISYDIRICIPLSVPEQNRSVRFRLKTKSNFILFIINTRGGREFLISLKKN